MGEFGGGFLIRLARVLAALLLGLCLLFFFMQRSMIFYPMQASREAQEELARQERLLPWLDGVGNLQGWRTPSLPPEEQPLARVVIFHGNAGFALHRTGLLRLLQATSLGEDMEFFIFEYPGYGSRGGKPSEAGFLESARIALMALKHPEEPAGEDRKEVPLLLVGESLGTGVACALAGENSENVQGVILLTPFDSLVSVARHHYPWLPVKWILQDRFDSKSKLSHFSGPVAFVLAENDEVVPAKLGQVLADSFPGPQKIWLVPGSDHNGVVGALSPSDWDEILRFALSDSGSPE